jgi:hypothetical protein
MSVALTLKEFLKLNFRILQAILPERAYEAFYGWAFLRYKALVRFLYYQHGLLVYSWREPEQWEMIKTIHSIMPYTLVGIGGLHATYRLAMKMNKDKVPGDFVELGVARGGCAALLGSTIFSTGQTGEVQRRRLRLFDSFEGLPEPTEKDFKTPDTATTGRHVRPLPPGSCLGTLEEVKYLLFDVKKFPESRIDFVKGWFENTVPAEKNKIDNIAILRIDGDWYESTKVCLEGFYDKVVPGGAVIIDDYHSCYGCQRAVDEFIQNRQLNVKMHFDGRGGCYFFKAFDSSTI